MLHGQGQQGTVSPHNALALVVGQQYLMLVLVRIYEGPCEESCGRTRQRV